MIFGEGRRGKQKNLPQTAEELFFVENKDVFFLTRKTEKRWKNRSGTRNSLGNILYTIWKKDLWMERKYDILTTWQIQALPQHTGKACGTLNCRKTKKEERGLVKWDWLHLRAAFILMREKNCQRASRYRCWCLRERWYFRCLSTSAHQQSLW